MKNTWITEGKIKDLATGNIYELSGTTYNEQSHIPEGNGLVLWQSKTKGDTIQRVKTTFSPTGLAKCTLTLVVKLDKWEFVEDRMVLMSDIDETPFLGGLNER